jgi:hypothetical protein
MKKVIVFCLFLMFFSVHANRAADSFVSYHKRANSLPSQNTFDFVSNLLPHDVDSLLILLFQKSDWAVEELFVADSLVSFALKYLPPIQKGIILYNIAYAYRDFDGVVCDSLLRNAYAIFKTHKDVEGQIFSLSNLLENSFLEMGIMTLEPRIFEDFQTLFRLKEHTTYVNAHERILGNQFNYQLFQGKIINEEFLDSIQMVLLKDGRSPTPYTSNILAEISIHHFGNQNIAKAIIAAKQALDFAKLFQRGPQDKSLHVYLSNLGYFFLENQQYDSAQFFLHAARDLVPQPHSAYHMHVKSNVLHALSKKHFQLGQLDSAYYYLDESLQLKVKAAELAQREKRSYADKKYEATVYKTKLDQSLLAAQRQRLKQFFYLIFTIALMVFSLTAFFLLRKREKLIVEAHKLSSSREKLLQVISHDFSSNIQSLIAYVKIYRDVKDQLEDKDLKTLEWNFIAAATALQTTMQNINYWATSFRKAKATPIQVVEVKELLEELLASYRLTAKLKNLRLFAYFQSCTIPVDGNAFATLCRNVINNAIKHAPSDAWVQLYAKLENKHLIISIANKCQPEDKIALAAIIDCMAHREVYLSQNGSLGMELICKALKKLGGTIEMGEGNSAPDMVVVLIRIPAHKSFDAYNKATVKARSTQKIKPLSVRSALKITSPLRRKINQSFFRFDRS